MGDQGVGLPQIRCVGEAFPPLGRHRFVNKNNACEEKYYSVFNPLLRRSGLKAEDLIMEDLPGMKETLERLPQAEHDQRWFRIKRVRVSW